MSEIFLPLGKEEVKGMVDRLINKDRVNRWRERKIKEGYKSLMVYLSPETMEMVKFLQYHFRTKRDNAKLITFAIETLYKKILRKSGKQ
jgi:hypothetical protein